MKAIGLTRCPVDGCNLRPAPWFCPVHWPFVSAEVRKRIVRFTKTMRGNGVGAIPPTLRDLLIEGVRDVASAPVALNVAERAAIALHAAVVGGAK